MNICRTSLAQKDLDVARPQIEITIKPSEVRVHIVSIIMASKSPKRQPAANLLGGWGKPAICYSYKIDWAGL